MNFMATTKDSAPAPLSSQPRAERLRSARAHALKEAIECFNNELMPDKERLEVLARIKWLKTYLSS